MVLSQATHDDLTGLLNRRAIFEQGERFAVLRSDVRPFVSLMLMDVDHFKNVNDTHGHLVGDEVLAGVAERLQEALRSGDLLGRYGGEEFLAMLVGGDHTAADAVASRTLDLMRNSPIVTSDGPLGITLSIGMSALASDERDLSGALQRADGALYESKRDGRARSTWRHSTDPFDVPGFQ
jgi:diguanylate cyclase (GGDEF)-like protein